MLARFLKLAWLPLLLTPGFSADLCAVPASLLTSRGANIFNAGREADLGDVLAEQLRQVHATIGDPNLTSFLQRIGDRITSRLSVPGTFHYELVDWPSPQAFTFPGNRIYVSRKIVAAAENENELAAIVAHEIGHAVVRQASVDITKEMRVRLGVHEVTSRRDVFEKYNELIEHRLNNPGKTVKLKEEKDQIAADQIGLFAMAAAGYDPEAMPRFFDRIADTKNDTGSFLSDLFNYTKPDSKRLREMLRSVPAIPAACHGSETAATVEDFKKWQDAVARYDVSRHTENLPGLISRVSLTPPLRSDLTRLRFSPDGRYILAQDRAGIAVLTRQPFAVAFRIEAGGADTAQFSPDSKTISFSDPMARMEIWDLATGSRRERRELLPGAPCALRRLASDARTFACYTGAGALFLLDVASGEELLRDQSFGVAPNVTWQVNTAPEQGVKYVGISPVGAAFSPDGRYLLASPSFSGNAPILFDVAKRAKVTLPRGARSLLANPFTFLSNDRLLVVNVHDPTKSSILSFPDLKTIGPLELLRGTSYEPVTKGDYLLMRPFRDFAVAVIDVSRLKPAGPPRSISMATSTSSRGFPENSACTAWKRTICGRA